MNIRLIFGLGVLLGLFSCQSGADSGAFEENAIQLEQRIHELECRRQALGTQIDSLWNGVASALEASLPSTMKPDERRNMIQVRNAELIRMFLVYPTLSDSIHQLVDRAGEQDIFIAREVQKLEKEQLAADSLLQQFYQKLETEAPDQLSGMRERLSSARSQPCVD